MDFTPILAIWWMSVSNHHGCFPDSAPYPPPPPMVQDEGPSGIRKILDKLLFTKFGLSWKLVSLGTLNFQNGIQDTKHPESIA